MPEPKQDAGIPQLVTELWEMVVAYFKQEAVEPLKALLRFMAYGVAGGICTSVGLVALLIGVLRLLQTETGSTFQGGLSPLPYVITLATGLVVIALAARAIVSGATRKAGS
ncbi:MAG TPA: hypothetical protein VNF50_12030 [Acidimicrobiales bacterium]|nr:hypothetical protein [Acidimicrobiales bacterium]